MREVKLLSVLASLAACTSRASVTGAEPEPDAAIVAIPDAPADGRRSAEPDGRPDAAADANNVCWPPACPTPTSGGVSVCGRVYDLESTAPVLDPNRGVTIRAYDFLDFLGAPGSAVALATAQVDACGFFVLAAAAAPTSGTFALVTSSADGARVLTATTRSANPGDIADWTVAFSLRATTDAAWSTNTGIGAPTLATRGVEVELFIDPTQPLLLPLPGAPAAGVTVTRSGSSAPADDFYLGDTDGLERTSPAPAATTTGVDGSSLLINDGTLATHSGVGSEPAGCRWQSHYAAAPAGVVFVALNVAVLSADPAQICH